MNLEKLNRCHLWFEFIRPFDAAHGCVAMPFSPLDALPNVELPQSSPW